FVEAPAYPFIGDKDLDVLGLPSDDARRATVRLANPLSDEQPLLRTTLLPGLISTALRNLSRGAEDLALFELGLIFQAKSQPKDRMAAPTRPTVTQKPTEAELDALAAILPDQPRHVAVLLTGAEVAGGWWGEPRPASWATAIAAGRLVAQTLGLELSVTPTDAAPFHPGRAAHLLLDAGPIGVAGELHPRVIEATGLPHRSCAMELDLDALIAAVGGLVPAPELGTMPVAKEDIALVVRQEVSAAELGDVLLAGGGDLLESVRLFDEFVDEKIGAGKRSLAFALRYRAPDRTLQAAEVAEVRQAAISAAAEAFGAVLRG
ncbi:MAG: phenylalanine--tRNA ligase subunit beta, partial [Actinomycetia bacterium]|nr:phenylalanine--tRNA ligase subunit beta [Actinomycetes bacterium]